MKRFKVPNFNNQKGAFLTSFAIFTTIGTIAFFVIYSIFGQVVPPNKIGVRRNYFKFGGILEEGFSSAGLAPGIHLVIPGISEIILLPRTLQLINLNREHDNGNLDLGSLEVPTTDGSKINTDVSLLVRIFESKEDSPKGAAAPKPTNSINDTEVPVADKKVIYHGGPRELINAFRDDPTKQLERFSQIGQDELRRTLSQLSTTEFYDTKKREQAAVDAQHNISEKVSRDGMELWGTLIRRYSYQDQEIDNRIFEKNLQTQTEKLRAASTKFAEAEAEVKQTEARWIAKIKDLQVEGENYVTKANSEAKFYEDTKVAEGDQLVKTREAEVLGEKNKLLSNVESSKLYLAKELAPFLKTLQGGIITGIDPYNINSWVDRLTGDRSNDHSRGGK